jgi:hypothetical protein
MVVMIEEISLGTGESFSGLLSFFSGCSFSLFFGLPPSIFELLPEVLRSLPSLGPSGSEALEAGCFWPSAACVTVFFFSLFLIWFWLVGVLSDFFCCRSHDGLLLARISGCRSVP